MNIKQIKESDIAKLADVFVSVFNSPPWNEEWTYDWAFDRLQMIFWSYRFYGYWVEVDRKPVAAVFARLGSYKGALELEIIENFVAESYQRRGVGSTLLDRLKEIAVKDGIECFVLQTDKNTFARNHYIKYGFKSHEENLLMSYEF